MLSHLYYESGHLETARSLKRSNVYITKHIVNVKSKPWFLSLGPFPPFKQWKQGIPKTGPSFIKKCKSKLQWGITSHQSEWPSSTNLQTINAGEDVEKRESSYTVGGNANWHNHYEEQDGEYPKTQESSLFSISSSAFIICRFYNYGHSDWCEVIPHCSFDLYFSNNEVALVIKNAPANAGDIRDTGSILG